MYCLTRELGASLGGLCGALAFELGTATVEINMWTLQVSDAYVWIPMILFSCERLLHRPSLGGTVGLGASIAVSLLSGSPQVIVYTYQLVALRVVFEYATRRPRASGSPLAAIACGLMLGPLLDAVHLVPGLQTAAASVRAGGLSWTDMQPELSVDLTSLHLALMQRADG